MESREYSFFTQKAASPEKQETFEVSPSSLEVVIVGKKESDPAENQKAFGEYIAHEIAREVSVAREQGKKLIFDMATGSSPRSIWPALERMVKDGLDVSNVIVVGHEEAWGTYEPGSKSDFDAYRKKEFFERNHLPIQLIESTDPLTEQDIEGNFVPMHLSDNPDDAASRYSEILHALHDRDDVASLALYGVGTEGHIGELQIHSLGREDSRARKNVYVEDLQNYSVEKGAFRWSDEQGGFHPEDNIFWQRGEATSDVGRAIWQGYKGMEKIMGLGWKETLDNDHFILALNDESKSLAFQLAMEGSMDGTLVNNEDQEAMKLKREKGEGEAILDELEDFALELEKAGVLPAGTVEKNRASQKKLKSGKLFEAIYHALDTIEAKSDDPRYERMWAFANRYIGKRAPVSRLIRLRTLLGMKTTIVATPEVVKGTAYEKLAS